MTHPAEKLRVVVAAPISAENCTLIVDLEPRLDLVVEHDLLPPMRHSADFSGDPGFRRTVEQQHRYESLVDSAEVLYGIPDVDPAALARTVAANAKLGWVHTMAAGGGGQVRAADLTDEQLERVMFTTSAGIHGEPLAEFAVLGVFAGAKSLPRLNRQQRDHEWSGRWAMGQVSDQTVLVLGLGGIGRAVARKLHALGATVIGTSRHDTAVDGVSLVVHPDEITDVLGRVDAIVAALPGTTTTEGFIGRDVLNAVRPGVTVVNVGRGTVIDEAALVDALADGRVGFAALDVFATEPLDTNSAFWDHPNVLVSPHTSALTDSEDRRIAELFAHNASRYLDGRELVNRVNTVEFY
jgi:phosphoglycerate dehydrogenase-like enzyme